MDTEFHYIMMKLLRLEMNYSIDSKASKRCFCNQFEDIAKEYILLIEKEKKNAKA